MYGCEIAGFHGGEYDGASLLEYGAVEFRRRGWTFHRCIRRLSRRFAHCHQQDDLENGDSTHL